MDNISSISNLSNWTLSLIIGIKAALTSGAQKNIVGELPFSDLLLTIPPIPKSNSKKNETILVSKRSAWATMLHKSFWMKGLESLHVTVNDNGRCPSNIGSDHVAPSMFYGLLEFQGGKALVYTRDQIKGNRIHISAYEYLGENPKGILKGKTNEECILKVKEYVEALKNEVKDKSSVKILDQVILLIDGKLDDPKRASEVVDRVSGRIVPMCEREKIREICCDIVDISPADLVELITVALGIARALAFSDNLYEYDAIIVAGYNITTAHEILSDMTEVPAEEQVGFSTSSHIETSQKVRIVDRYLSDNKTLMMPVVELLLTVAILYLSKIGPLLSMYVCRQSLQPYREGMLKRGSSMRWAISNIKLYHTGCARDDWLMCITKASRVELKIQLWRFLLVACCIVPFGFWGVWSPEINPEPNEDMQHILSVVGLAGGATWLIMSIFTQTEANKNKDILRDNAGDDVAKSPRSPMNVGEITEDTDEMPEDLAEIDGVPLGTKNKRLSLENARVFLLLLIPVIYVTSFFSVKFADSGNYGSWVYTWVFEIGVGILWITGELLEGTDVGWIVESTSFYMMGILSAIRLA